MKGARRIVTRSVSATGTFPSSSFTATTTTTTTTTLEVPQEHQSQPQSGPEPLPTLRKRQSSTGLDEIKLASGSTIKRQRNDPTEESSQEERSTAASATSLEEVATEPMDADPIQEPPPPVPLETLPTEPQEIEAEPPQPPPPDSSNMLKRSRSPEDAEPRKRQAFDPTPPTPTPRTPFLNLASKVAGMKLPKSRSLPSMFTPVGAGSSRSSASTTKKRASFDPSPYRDFVVPLKGGDGSGQPSIIPPSPAFTFNPFQSHEDHPNVPERAAGDAAPTPKAGGVFGSFGPAVQSLSRLLEEDNEANEGGEISSSKLPSARPPTLPDNDQDDAIPFPPSPTKAVFPSKPRPSMIPRLVLAPPPPPHPPKFTHPTPVPPKHQQQSSPAKTSFTKFFASPIKPSGKPVVGKPPPPPKFMPTKTKTVGGPAAAKKANANTTLSVEAQASLANLSMALEKLSMPRPRTSLGSRSSSDEDMSVTVVGSASGSPEDDIQARLKELPERPSTSLGLSSPTGSKDGVLQQTRRVSRRIVAGTGLFPSKSIPAAPKHPVDTTPATDKGKGKAKQDSPPETSPAPAEPVETISDCLQGCVIYVDVRTDEGSDASAMFIQMLRQLSAKVITRPGSTATHYVWKSGLQSTLTRYTAMKDDPSRPFLVGIGWVVKCVEKKERVNESKYAVNVKDAEVVFGTKRRRSFQVKDRSAMTNGLVPTRPLATTTANMKARPISNPRVPQSASSKKPVAVTSKFARSIKGKAKAPVAGLRLAAPPTPVKEVAEEEEDEDVDMEEVVIVPPAAPPVPQVAPAPTPAPEVSTSAKPKPSLPPLLFPKKASAGPLDGLDTLLAETQTSLLAEAQQQTITAEQLERARKRNSLFAPKISSPLKRNFRVSDDSIEEEE